MAKGIVLLVDAESTRAIRQCWGQLEAAGIPSLESFTHRRHEPHVSLVVAEESPPAAGRMFSKRGSSRQSR
jgi:hypothetical protein